MSLRGWYIGFSSACMIMALAACTPESTSSALPDKNDNLATRTIAGSFEGAIGAVKSPFEDLNLVRNEIPAELEKLSGSPYALPSPLQCKVLKQEIAQLDSLLGPDMAPKIAKDDDIDYAEEGAGLLQGQAVGFVAGKASIIPFRGVVRQITGAARHSKEYARAYESGKLRRAYIKGISSALKCSGKPKPQMLAQKSEPVT